MSGELATWEADCEWEAWSFSPIDARRRWLGEDGRLPTICTSAVQHVCEKWDDIWATYPQGRSQEFKLGGLN